MYSLSFITKTFAVEVLSDKTKYGDICQFIDDMSPLALRRFIENTSNKYLIEFPNLISDIKKHNTHPLMLRIVKDDRRIVAVYIEKNGKWEIMHH